MRRRRAARNAEKAAERASGYPRPGSAFRPLHGRYNALATLAAPIPVNPKRLCDNTSCPHCAAEAGAPGRSYAGRYFQHGDALYGVCGVHGVYWFVTRRLLCRDMPEPDPQLLATFTEVELLWLR